MGSSGTSPALPELPSRFTSYVIVLKLDTKSPVCAARWADECEAPEATSGYPYLRPGRLASIFYQLYRDSNHITEFTDMLALRQEPTEDSGSESGGPPRVAAQEADRRIGSGERAWTGVGNVSYSTMAGP